MRVQEQISIDSVLALPVCYKNFQKSLMRRKVCQISSFISRWATAPHASSPECTADIPWLSDGQITFHSIYTKTCIGKADLWFPNTGYKVFVLQDYHVILRTIRNLKIYSILKGFLVVRKEYYSGGYAAPWISSAAYCGLLFWSIQEKICFAMGAATAPPPPAFSTTMERA